MRVFINTFRWFERRRRDKNANGIRTSKTIGDTTHFYTLEGTKILREDYCGSTLIPLYDNSDEVCGIQFNGSPYFFQKNLQGDVIAITNASGVVTGKYEYDAWGKILSITDQNGIDISSNVFHIANINPFRYRSYYYDTEISMYYLQSRYYDPEVGRFVNADRAIADLNLFSYCTNNTTNFYDANGMDAIWINSSDDVQEFGINLGHTSLIIQFMGSWYYTFYGCNATLIEKVPSFAMYSLSAFNQWSKTVTGGNDYDSATYIQGVFSFSFAYFLTLSNKLKGAGDPKYTPYGNNCSTQSWKLLQLGILKSGMTIKNYMKRWDTSEFECSKPSWIPNLNNMQIISMFANTSFTRKQAIKQINSRITSLQKIPNIIRFFTGQNHIIKTLKYLL